MATTSFREDYLGRDLVAPTTAATDFLGTVTTATVDRLGRPLRRIARANTTAVTLGQEIQFLSTNEKFTVTVAGTTAASPPTAPAVGATVADGTATLLRTK
jgi:hypothetical protein